MAAGASNEQIISGVASILQEASAALARLGALSAGGGSGGGASRATVASTGSTLAGAAAALAEVAATYGGGRGAGAEALAGGGDAFAADAAASAGLVDGYARYASESETPLMSANEFVATNQLESWVGDALNMLTVPQIAAVVNPPMNVGNARNPNGIVVSRIKQVVSLEQRLQIFIAINQLGDGVVDRISTLTAEQAEAMMESGLKIQKATNPSGVAMKRISDVIRSNQGYSSQHAFQNGAARASSRAQRGGGLAAGGAVLGDYGHGTPPWRTQGGGNAGGSAADRHDRSRSRAPAGAGPPQPELPPDVQGHVEALGLEWWCGEVLRRLSLFQRQQIVKDLGNMQGVRNPSGVVMSRVKQIVDTKELMSIFIDLNSLDASVEAELAELTSEQQAAVIAPGIYLQNVRDPPMAVRSRITSVLSGSDAFSKPPLAPLR